MNDRRDVVEFGDFQTPVSLARSATEALKRAGIKPLSILEPTCGKGAFLAAAAAAFPDAGIIIGVDINAEHLASASGHVRHDGRIRVQSGDFFTTTWDAVLDQGCDPWLILGNPPWVTNSRLGALDSRNLPEKSNHQGLTGIEALTGKSNFDISEWMLLRYLEWLEHRRGAIGVLCKTAVARKVLLAAWKRDYPIKQARMHRIDAAAEFGVAVDACLLVIETDGQNRSNSCELFDKLEDKSPSRVLAYQQGHLVNDAKAFERSRDLLGPEDSYVWRSGIKHDCARIMELKPSGAAFVNGLGETVSLESRFLFPLLKSSDVGNGRTHPRAMMLVPQQSVGQDTADLERQAPLTWSYLQRHRALLEKRASSIYRNKPPFSIFGVGPYSFSPWKIAISGFYKKIRFVRVCPVDGLPVVFDDTVYFLPCSSKDEADFLFAVLTSEAAADFFRAMISWDEKRPVTVEMLRRLSIEKLAKKLRLDRKYAQFTERAGPMKKGSAAA
jgi:hypothetical protein